MRDDSATEPMEETTPPATDAAGERDPVDSLKECIDGLLSEGHDDEALGNVLKRSTDPAHLTAAGDRFFEEGDARTAASLYERALQLNPSDLRVYRVLGNALRVTGNIPGAVRAFREALAIKPDPRIHSRLLLTLQSSSEEPKAIFEAHRRWGELYGSPPAPMNRRPTRPRPTPLRVGYLSPDFRSHPVAYFIAPVLAHHDRARVTVIAYSTKPGADGVTRRLQKMVDGWRDCVGMSARELANLIVDDRIDILVDLAGHTSGNRLDVMSIRPAPVQVTYLGYADTTGVGAIDFRLTDPFADPEGTTDHLHVEKLFRLSPGCLTFEPPSDAPEVSPLPAVQNQSVTFGSFNKYAKVSDTTVDLWVRVLNAVPGSRLLLKTGGLQRAQDKARAFERFADAGLRDTQRIEILDLVPSRSEHLRLYGRVDIGLDTHPYSGTTTTCQALWMGVPVVTLPGARHVSRMTGSILRQVGLDRLIASDKDSFVGIAARLAADLDELRQLRSALRQAMLSSPLLQHRLFTRKLEDAYEQMWDSLTLSGPGREQNGGISG